ncbi:hypothetical protein CP8484711_1953A, partial [Chlamydia psittaci 84-8471/1]
MIHSPLMSRKKIKQQRYK